MIDPRVVLADAPLDDRDLREHAAKVAGEVDLVVSFADEDAVRYVRSAA